MVEEIPVLREGPETDRALELLAEGRHRDAVSVLSAPPFRSRADQVLMRLGEWVLGRPAAEGPAARRIARRLDRGSHEGFAATVQLLFGRPPWGHPGTAEYFVHRRSDPSFVAAEAFAAALLQEKAPVLDLGCGVGHLLASLGTTHGIENVAGADGLFAALLLARRYVAPRAFLVCADAGLPLPFEDGLFGAIVCADAFFDFPSLPLAASELKRVLAPDGTALLPHLHNRLVPHRYPGRCPLSPAEYLEVLAPLAPRLTDERAVLDAALERRSARFSWTRDPAALESTPDLSAVGGDVSDDWIGTGPIPPAPVGPLAVNPLYEARRDGQIVRLRRGRHRYTSEEESGEVAQILPDESMLAWEVYRRLPSWDAAPGLQRTLIRARVVLPTPPGTLPGGRGFVEGSPPPPLPRRHRSGIARLVREARDQTRVKDLARALRDEAHLRLAAGGGLAVLAGHRVTPRRGPDPLDLAIPADALTRALEALALAGPILPFDEAIAGLASGRLPEGMSFALTFDDGTEDTLEWGAAILRDRGLRAGAFLCGREAVDAEGRFWWDRSKCGGRRASPQDYLLRGDVFLSGHHGHSHRSLETLSDGELERELLALEVPTGPWLAYPFGRMEDAGPRAARAARNAGFETALTMRPGIAVPGGDPLLLPRIALYDEPPGALLARILELLQEEIAVKS